MNFEEMTKEQLIEFIKNISEEQNGKYGIVWDKEKEPEKIVEECDKYIPVLKEIKNKSVVNSGIENILIEGDNFHSLSVLNYTHKEKIDFIYIDPPYNTGSNDFMYNDKFIDEQDGYRHSKWLNFMEKRLKLSKNLLKDTGSIFISIDDNELCQLKLLCDKIFGEKNRIVNAIVTSAPAGSQSSNDFAIQHSYCLGYKMPNFKANTLERTKEALDDRYPYSDEKGRYYLERIWKRGVGGRKEDVPSLHFPVYYDIKSNKIYIDNEYCKSGNCKQIIKIIPYQTVGVLGRWTWSREKMKKERENLTVKFTSGEYKLYKKVYEENESGQKPFSIIGSEIGRTELGSLELKNILNKKTFFYPKPVELIKHFIKICTNKDAIVLDFFAGSGTTGQAVLELNKEDGGNRQFIVCTNNENGICDDVTLPRLRTVITGIRDDKTKYSDGLEGSLKFFTTKFVDYVGTRDQLYYDLTEECIPMLCVKGNTYEKVEVNNEFAIYSNKDKTQYSCIYFDIFGEKYNDFIEKIKMIREFKYLYVFTLGDYVNPESFSGVENYKIEPIPYKIVELYKIVVKMSKED